MQQVPFYISALFAATAIITLFFLYKATRSKLAVLLVIGCLVLQGIIGWSGFYTVTDAMPARFLLTILPPLVFIIFIFATRKGRAFIDSMDVEWSILLHTVRIPVEIVLFSLYTYKQIPEIMTFEGRNFDILSGISALVIWWGYRQGWIKGIGLIVWNVICLGLLANVVTTAILSAPFPFQQLAFDQPNVAILYFPYIWLPCFIVPAVLFSHLVVIRKTWHAMQSKQGAIAM